MAKTNETALTVLDAEKAMIPTPEDLAGVIEDIGDLIKISVLGVVNIAAAGAGTFNVREPGAEEAEKGIKEIQGVIIAHHPVNVRWAAAFSERGEDERPACKSVDGETGIDTETGERIDCATCPHNQFGPDGGRKACANKRQLYIMRDGDLLPVLMALPPSGLRAFDNYRVSCKLTQRRDIGQVVTRIRLKSAKNAQRIEYSAPVFEAVALLDLETAGYLKAFGASMVQTLQKARMTVDDEPAAPAAPAENGAGFVAVQDDDLPF